MKKCKIIIKHGRGKREVTGDFYGFFQISQVLNPSPFIDGHKGGVLADVVAVVDVGQGPRKFYIEDITKLYDENTKEEQEEEINKKATEEGTASFVYDLEKDETNYDLEKDETKKNCCEDCEKCKEKKAAEEGIARFNYILNDEGLLKDAQN